MKQTDQSVYIVCCTLSQYKYAKTMMSDHRIFHSYSITKMNNNYQSINYYLLATVALFIAIAVVLASSGCNNQQKANATAEVKHELTREELVTRGKYIVTAIGGCNDCHTPMKMGAHGPEPDMEHMLSGHPEQFKLTLADVPKADPNKWVMIGASSNTAFAGPWGISFAMNLTPDSVTGLGAWTEDMFIKAIRTGKHMGVSRPIMPPMPQPAFSHMTDEDLKSIFAYLNSIPKIHNQVPDYIPPVPQAQ